MLPDSEAFFRDSRRRAERRDASPWLASAAGPWTNALRVVQSDSQMRFLMSVWMSSMLCCTAADSILLRKPWTSFRNFLADSSACVGPRRTLTTTRTKCSNATASSTSMPLLQRAAALQQTDRITFPFQPKYHIRGIPRVQKKSYLATVATTMRAASSL
ncbi:hypothetical protein EYF80_015097 [Liparis tanakae]|uniref:Uncharacterized protein n=1 Tax=Liparis tanakae TaxID=230148 RepID=A0A4Z2I9L4_9TELE|nr:hypothetical protein EYF80_015097 [Liparis tanakae]